jgi:AcrR family transcriptional regulator
MPKVTQEHRDARRRQILAAAREVFADKGFTQTSTGEIVAASGLSTGAVYSYFPSKNDLVAAVCEDAGLTSSTSPASATRPNCSTGSAPATAATPG